MRNKKNTILVIDDDSLTYRILNIALDKNEFKVVECAKGKDAVALCVSLKPDILLLSMQIPDMSGKDIITSIKDWSQVPIIIVTEQDSNKEVIDGLNMGADDYVFKPFNTDVLRARINASLRKSAVLEAGEPELINGPLRIDLVRHKVFLDDQLISFTPKEYNLLRYFILHCGKILGHRDILRNVWGKAHSSDTQYLRVFIGQIREKIERDPTNPTIITTEMGIGYRMEFISVNSNVSESETKI